MRNRKRPHRQLELTLVRSTSKSANKTRNNHHLIHEDSNGNSRSRQTRRQEKVHKQERRRDEPVNVPDVEDFTRAGSGNRGTARTHKLGRDGSLSQTRGHRVVGNGSDQGDGGRDVVEQPVAARLAEAHAHKGEGRCPHDGANGPVPVGAMIGDLKTCRAA